MFLQCLQYGTRYHTKIWCKFDIVTFNVKRVPVFRLVTITSRDFASFKKHRETRQDSVSFVESWNGIQSARWFWVRPHIELRTYKPCDCGTISNRRWRSFLEFWFLSWIFLGYDCRFHRCMCSRNTDRRFCGVAWRFHLNNIAKAIVIVDVEIARGTKHFLKISYAPIW